MSARLPINPLLKAVFERLSADMAAAPAVPVFDHVPDEQGYPYVEIGAIAGTNAGSKTHGGKSVSVTFHAYSAGKGKKEVDAILNRVLVSLTTPEELTLEEGFDATFSNLDTFEVIPEEYEDGTVQHGILTQQWIVTDRNALT